MLEPSRFAKLLDLVATVNNDDTNCDECFERVAEYAEVVLSSMEIPEAMVTVQRHLEQCVCCRDEFEALLEGLRATLSERPGRDPSEN